MRNIESVLHVSRHTISKVYKAADSHSILWENGTSIYLGPVK